jgi:ankyrin repeat protein
VLSLLQQGVDPNERLYYRETVLMTAVVEGHCEVVDCLIKHGAKVDAKNDGGIAALMLAASDETATMTQLLLDAGADVNARDAYGRTALFHAAQFARAEVVKLLLANGVNPHITNRRGKTALQITMRDASSSLGRCYNYDSVIALLKDVETKWQSSRSIEE